VDAGVARGARHRHVARMGGDAALARPQHRVDAVVAVQGGAAGAGRALVAGVDGVAEVVAAGALHEVAADRRHVADLRAGAREERLGERRVAPPYGLVVGEVAVAHVGADPHAAAGQGLDLRQRQGVDVDQDGGSLDVELQEVDEGRAAGEELRPAVARHGVDRLVRPRGSGVGEGVHAGLLPPAPCAAWIAATMLG
jgi:hypothetical protein